MFEGEILRGIRTLSITWKYIFYMQMGGEIKSDK